MNLTELADQIREVRLRIDATISNALLDEFGENAFDFVRSRLQEMEHECRTGKLKPADLRYPELARIAVESDPRILPPKLGGELIQVEKRYRQST